MRRLTWTYPAGTWLFFFFSFSQKKIIWHFMQTVRFDISCKLSVLETVCMEFQILFSGKNKKKYHQFVVCWKFYPESGKDYLTLFSQVKVHIYSNQATKNKHKLKIELKKNNKKKSKVWPRTSNFTCEWTVIIQFLCRAVKQIPTLIRLDA